MAGGLQVSRVSAVDRQVVNGAIWWAVTLLDGTQFGFTTNPKASGRYDLILKNAGYMADYTGVSQTFAGGITVYLKSGGTATYNPGNFPSYTNLVKLPETTGPATEQAGAQQVVVSPPPPAELPPIRQSNKYSKWAVPIGISVVAVMLAWAMRGFKV